MFLQKPGSASIPAEPVLSTQNSHIRTIVFGSFLIWILGISGIFFSFRLTKSEYRERSRLIEQLKNALKEVKTLKWEVQRLLSFIYGSSPTKL